MIIKILVLSTFLLSFSACKSHVPKFKVGDCIASGPIEEWTTADYIIEKVGDRMYLARVVGTYAHNGKPVVMDMMAEINFGGQEDAFEKIDCKGAAL